MQYRNSNTCRLYFSHMVRIASGYVQLKGNADRGRGRNVLMFCFTASPHPVLQQDFQWCCESSSHDIGPLKFYFYFKCYCLKDSGKTSILSLNHRGGGGLWMLYLPFLCVVFKFLHQPCNLFLILSIFSIRKTIWEGEGQQQNGKEVSRESNMGAKTIIIHTCESILRKYIILYNY